MKRIKLLFTILLLSLMLPINSVFADSYTVESNTSSNGKHYFWVSGIPKVASSYTNVAVEESDVSNYIEDYDGNKYNFYSVTLEVETDGTSEAYEYLVSKIKSSSFGYYEMNELTYTSEDSYTVDGKTYTPEVDVVILGMGDVLSIKNMDGQSYGEGEFSGWTVLIQYYLNRYKTTDERNETLDSTDPNESNMRKGYVQVSIFYPAGSDITDSFAVDSSNTDAPNVNDINEDISDKVAESLGNGYTVAQNNDGSTTIKNEDNKEVIEIGKEEDNKLTVTIKDENLTDEEIYEVVTDALSSIVGEDATITIDDNGIYTVSNSDNTEVYEISKIEDGKLTVTIKQTSNYVENNEEATESENKVSLSEDAIVKVAIVGIVIAIIAVVYAFVVVNKNTKKRK